MNPVDAIEFLTTKVRGQITIKNAMHDERLDMTGWLIMSSHYPCSGFAETFEGAVSKFRAANEKWVAERTAAASTPKYLGNPVKPFEK